MKDARDDQGAFTFAGMKTFVFSRTLQPGDHVGVNLVGEDFVETLTSLKEEPGKDIWLFGGGLLFKSLSEAGFVDSVEVAVVPVLLGEGTPLLPPQVGQTKLKLTSHRVLEKTGTVLLSYDLE